MRVVRPATWKRSVCPLAMVSLFAGVACSGGSTTTPSTAPQSATFHADLADPLGDAVEPGVLNPPDLLHGSVDVNGGNVTFTVQFAPGTLNPQTTRLILYLDTDQDASTGNPIPGPLGIDYLLDMFASRNQTAVTQATLTLTSCPTAAPCYIQVASAPLTVGTDMMTTTVPLALLGNTSGRMNFRVSTQAFTSPTTPTPNSDWMPDTTLPPAHVP